MGKEKKKQDDCFILPSFKLFEGKEITSLSIDIKIFDRSTKQLVFGVKNQPPKKAMRKAVDILEFKG